MKCSDSRVVLITGGGNGLGNFIGLSLLEQGHRVAVIDISAENAGQVEKRYPDRFLSYVCDVRNDDEVAKAVSNVVITWGRIDVLVNNAALAIFKGFEEKTLDETRREFDVNYFGYLRMIKAVVPYMKQQGKGIIHNVSSAVGVTGFKGIYGYVSTKGAIEALTKTLSIELEPHNIQVSLIHPPLMNTKSAAPLGVPPQVMEDPEVIGRKLARKLFSSKRVITPDIKTSIFLRFSYLFPYTIGRFLSQAAEKGREQNR